MSSGKHEADQAIFEFTVVKTDGRRLNGDKERSKPRHPTSA